MGHWITHIVNTLGYVGIAALMVLENVFPPIPSEVIMPLAGYVTTQGALTLVGVSVAGMVGSVLGALPLYYLGYAVGPERLGAWAERHGRWIGLSRGDLERAQGWFDRHGKRAVFFCRLVPGVRSLISIPAGVAHMSLVPFLFYSALGTGLWATLLAYLGRLLGENYDRVQAYVGPAGPIVLGALVVAFIGWILWRKHSKE